MPDEGTLFCDSCRRPLPQPLSRPSSPPPPRRTEGDAGIVCESCRQSIQDAKADSSGRTALILAILGGIIFPPLFIPAMLISWKRRKVDSLARVAWWISVVGLLLTLVLVVLIVVLLLMLANLDFSWGSH